MPDGSKPSEIVDYTQVLGSGRDILEHVNGANPDNILVYVHLPKAAGNSSIAALRHHFEPYVSVDWRNPKKHMAEIVANWTDDPVRFISGHTQHDALEIIRTSSLPHACVTFLRHPVERIISVYRYGTSAKSPMQEVNLARYPTLEHYVFKVVKTNEISRFLLGREVESLVEYKQEMRKFAFVGVSELLPFCHLILSKMFKIPFSYPGRANITDNPDVGVAVPQRLLDHLYTTQKLDMMFHAYVVERYCEMTGVLVQDCDARERR